MRLRITQQIGFSATLLAPFFSMASLTVWPGVASRASFTGNLIYRVIIIIQFYITDIITMAKRAIGADMFFLMAAEAFKHNI